MTYLYRGCAISGLEFGTSFPGSEGVDYFQSANGLFAYLGAKGGNCVRIAFKWERMQFDTNGSINQLYLSQLDDQINKAANNGMKTILSCHNFGRKRVTSLGGFTDDFSSSSSTNFSGSYSIGSGVLTASEWNRVAGGHVNNPYTPADSYKVTVDAKITSNGGSDVWRELWIEVYRTNDSNKYFFVMNNLLSVIRLVKVVSGTTTIMQSKSYTINLNTFYTIIIDVGQETPGTIKAKVNGTTELSQTMDAGLTAGQVAFFGSGVNWQIDNFTLNVDGDTTSGGTTSRTLGHGDGILTAAHFADFWDKMSEIYKDNDNVICYDLMNEMHDMPTPTTTSNYNTTATATVAYQAAVDAIRANGDTKYCAVELDNWANIHRFNDLYGTDPTPWITDSLNKIVYSAHAYFDSDHSGSYSGGWDSDDRLTNMHEEILPFLQWCHDREVLCLVGEVGTPHDDDRWLSVLYTFYKYCDDLDIWGLIYWAAGDNYTSPTTITPTSTYTVDRRTMGVVELFPGGDHTPYTGGDKLKFQSIDTESWSKTSMQGSSDAYGGYTLTQIDNWMSLISQMGATHVAINCPLDAAADYPVSQGIDASGGIGYLRNWVDKARKYGLHILFRGAFIGFDGTYDTNIQTYSIRSPGVKTQEVSNLSAGSWLKKIYDFVVNNGALASTYGDLIEENDILGFFPDPTQYQFYPTNPAQGQTETMFSSAAVMSQFYFDLKVVLDIALTTINKRGVYTGYSSAAYTDLNSSYIPINYCEAEDLVSVNHYDSVASDWMDDIVALHAAKSALGTHYKTFIGEFGDIYSSNDTDRATKVQEYLNEVDDNLDILSGVNYWAAATALINPSAFTLTAAGTVVLEYFGGNPDPEGTAVPSALKPIMSVQRTNAQVSNPGITYNEAGFTYNQSGTTYGGVYGKDIIPMNVRIR